MQKQSKNRDIISGKPEYVAKAEEEEKKKQRSVMTPERREELRKIWQYVQAYTKKDPKLAQKFISELDEATVTDLRTMINPYKQPVMTDTKKRLLSFTFINMREKYLKRFAMTSFIGFIFRMLDEWTHSSVDKYVSEESGEFQEKFTEFKKTRELNMTILDYTKSTAADDQSSDAILTRAKYLMALIYVEKQYLIDVRPVQEALTKFKAGNEKYHDRLTGDDQDTVNYRKDYDEKMVKLAQATAAVELREKTIESLEEKLNILRKEYYYAVNPAEKLIKSTKPKKSSTKSTKKGSRPTTEKRWYDVFNDIGIVRHELTDAEYDEVTEETKKFLGWGVTKESENDKIKQYIEDFLLEYLKYNPDLHVQSAYCPNYADPKTKPIEPKKETTPERILIPPTDTFVRWQRYTDANYECLRQATDDIYCERSDLEFAINPLEVFEGDDAMEKVGQFNRKYADEFEGDVYTAGFRHHTLIAPFAQNRDKIDLYTKKTEIIKKIIEQSEKDAKIGKEMLKDRAKGKKKNVKVAKPPSSYTDSVQHVSKYGTAAVDTISSSDLPRETRDSTKDEIDVEFHVLKTRKTGRRIRGEIETSKFILPAENLKPEQVVIKDPKEARDDVMMAEAEDAKKYGSGKTSNTQPLPPP